MLIATSSCLLGNQVRYDGTDKRTQALYSQLPSTFGFEAVCPEHLAFGTPRHTIDIVLIPGGEPGVLTTKTSEDVTSVLQKAIDAEISRLKKLPIAGMILKARSPSCAIETVPYHEDGQQVAIGDGLFTRACRVAFPRLPMIDEEQLLDRDTVAEFINQVTAYHAAHV